MNPKPTSLFFDQHGNEIEPTVSVIPVFERELESIERAAIGRSWESLLFGVWFGIAASAWLAIGTAEFKSPDQAGAFLGLAIGSTLGAVLFGVIAALNRSDVVRQIQAIKKSLQSQR